MIVKYRRSRESKDKIRKELETFPRFDGRIYVRAEKYYVPDLTYDYDATSNANQGAGTGKWTGQKTKRRSSTSSVPLSFAPKVQWCWKEHDSRMDMHTPSDIFGNKADCWVKYDESSNSSLEAAYLEQGQTGTFSPTPTYSVDFDKMTQRNVNTGYLRDVQRVVPKGPVGRSTSSLAGVEKNRIRRGRIIILDDTQIEEREGDQNRTRTEPSHVAELRRQASDVMLPRNERSAKQHRRGGTETSIGTIRTLLVMARNERRGDGKDLAAGI